MAYNAAGTPMLPVEVWQHIFSNATDIHQVASSSHGDEFCYFFLAEEEALLRDPRGIQTSNLIRARLSIVLVCRSWYLMGIPIFWSHLQVPTHDPQHIHSIYESLTINPGLANYVTRVTILQHPSMQLFDDALSMILQILPTLANLSAIACSLNISLMLPTNLRTKMATLHSGSIIAISDFIRRSENPDASFWNRCQVLSFTFDGRLATNFLRDVPSQLTFNKLNSLRLYTKHSGVAEWISTYWNTPILQNLSILPDRIQWTQLLRKNSLNLRTLQIRAPWDYVSIARIDMPNLMELHSTSTGKYLQGTYKETYAVFSAPKLSKCVFYIEANLANSEDYHIRFTVAVEAILRQYPSLREIAIVDREENWAHPSNTSRRFIIKPEDVYDWCERGLTVEIVVIGVKVKRYTPDSYKTADYEGWDDE